MKWFFRIDQLLIFLILSLSIIVMADPAVLFGVKKDTTKLFSRTAKIEDVIYFPKSGFYQESDCLFVYNPNAKLKLSLNGEDSFQEFGPSEILNSLTNENISQLPMSLHWKSPGLNLPELKSIIVDAESPGNFGETDARVLTYYQDWGSDLPVVSLNTKNSNLYDEAFGIMNYGQSSWTDSGFYKSWWYRSANFAQRGIEWERPVNFQYFEKGELMFEQNCGIRISGNATRYFPQKSFRIYARELYGLDKIEFPFWGEDGIKSSTSILLRNGGNDNTKTMFADLLMQRLAFGTNVLLLAGHPVSVFINGNYWGIYNIRERIDANYVAEYENVKEDEVTILDAPNGTLKEGSEKVQQEFLEMVNELSEESILTNENYLNATKLIDINSFIDYIIFETFYANNDWPHNNCTWYKADEGKWKWILYDLDVGLAYNGIENVNTNMFNLLLEGNTITSRLFRALNSNQKFKNEVKLRVDELMKNNLCESNIESVYTELKSLYSYDIQFHLNRWRQVSGLAEWLENCNSNLEFLITRKEIYLDQVNNF